MESVKIPKKKISQLAWDSDGPLIVFKEEVMEWCKASLSPGCMESVLFHEGHEVLTFFFKDAGDAVLFKLRWGGE